MALGIESMTYGRDQKGITTLVTEIDTKIGNILKSMDSNATEFKNIETTIKKYWIGVDADNFVKSLKSGNTKVVNSIKSIRGNFIAEFENNEKAFAKFQERNKLI